MHDLCTRPDHPEPSQNGSPTPDTEMSNGEPESLAGPRHPDRENPSERPETVSVTNLGSSTTNGNSMTVPSTLLGKRHHSLYEGLNGCEARGFGKVKYCGFIEEWILYEHKTTFLKITSVVKERHTTWMAAKFSLAYNRLSLHNLIYQLFVY